MLNATSKSLIRAVIKEVSKKSNKSHFPKKITVFNISERESCLLNRRYRKHNRPTNVLSFRYGPEYGEILLCPKVIKKEAKEQKNSYIFQKKWMVIHGLLHLAGLDHEGSRQNAKKFDKVEKELLE